MANQQINPQDLQQLLGIQAAEYQKQKTYADSLRERRMNTEATWNKNMQTAAPVFDNSNGQVNPLDNFNAMQQFFQAGKGYVTPMSDIENADGDASNILQAMIESAKGMQKTPTNIFDEIKKIQELRKNAIDQGLSTDLYDKTLEEYGIKTSGKTEPQSNQSKALEMVNNLIGGNYQAISGGFKTPNWLSRTGLVKGAGKAKAEWSGLRDLLALAKRGELKGSGTISDFEVKMLQKAALAGLDPDVQTEEEFLAGLQNLKSDLESAGGVDSRGTELDAIDENLIKKYGGK